MSVMAVLPVICDLWPNLARRGRTKGVCQQIAVSAKQKPPRLMRQKACGSPASPQELPNAAQIKPEIKKSRRQAHFYSTAKVFLFHGLSGFSAWGCNRAEKGSALPFSVTVFQKAGFASAFFICLPSFLALPALTPFSMLFRLFLKVLKSSLVAFRGVSGNV